MKVTIFETENWEEAALRQRLSNHDLRCSVNALNENTAAAYADSQVISTFIASTLNDRVLELFPSLKLIVTRSVGFDHIDLKYCHDHNVTVCNIPDYGDYTVAEHTFALLLAINRRIVAAVEHSREGKFDHESLRGVELRGKTLGVIGTGRIGLRAIEIAKGFGMIIVAHDVRPNIEAARSIGFRYLGLDELLASADFVTLHLPETAASHHLLSDREFLLMKPGAVLINTARGTIVDTEALVRALATGRVSAAGLDVLPQEPMIGDEAQIFRSDHKDAVDFRALVADHVLLNHPNVLVTPHNAYNTIEAMHRILESSMTIIEAFANGKPQNVVHVAA
ncbi:hydroxyacid dehydrogenase [Methylovirgula sp. HY1]|uniref:hydroxyacid dehydrogenase n=1 Tax=Methylovirgula sp. HY1 TaxID=2822761 RepID=UPI001C5BA00F|nr:hydroxyacid dehydrogenase [Methylovirgula sp. HY1]QXX76636.1 D-lactate dehydrogenase [Methylovirgula sp. HY1]